jgi:hypothetical protein
VDFFFQFTLPFRPHYGPGVDMTSNKNEYQESSWWVEGGWSVRLTILPPSLRKCGILDVSHPYEASRPVTEIILLLPLSGQTRQENSRCIFSKTSFRCRVSNLSLTIIYCRHRFNVAKQFARHISWCAELLLRPVFHCSSFNIHHTDNNFDIHVVVLNEIFTYVIMIQAIGNFSNRPFFPLYRSWRSSWLRDVEAPTFSDIRLMRQGCQPVAPAAFYPPEDSWYLFLLQAESTPVP